MTQTPRSLLALLPLILFSTLAPACAQRGDEAKTNPMDSPKENRIRPSTVDTNDARLSRATFASGCFWCVEEVFESVKGVREAVSGYAGGTERNPTYEQVGSGATSHAEAVMVYYDSSVVDYPTLVRVFFASQDPTQVNGQGPDRGRQYRSIAFFRNQAERSVIQKTIDSLNRSGAWSAPIVTEITASGSFWPAEEYHQNYVQIHPDVSYVRGESIPRIIRFQKQFPGLLKPERSRL